MTYAEFVSQFKQRIKELSYNAQFSLAISVCKQLYPDYKDFCLENEWGDSDDLLDAIVFCETFHRQGGDRKVLKVFLKKVMDNCPDSEDFENASYAINASGAVHATLEFVSDRDSEHIFEIGTYLTDTADFKIRDEDEELTEAQIDAHPLMTSARNYLLSGG